MKLPATVAISLKKLNKNKSDFESIVSEMKAAENPSREQVIDWRSRWTRYVSIQSLYLTHLRQDMEVHGVDSVPGPVWPALEQVEAVQHALWPD